MRIYTPAGPLAFRQFAFPDGQRHFELQSWDQDFREATIEARIAHGDDLLDVLLAQDALSMHGYAVSLDIRYLLGARMDRRINSRQPFTLSVIARILNGAGFRRVRVLDPHSDVALTLLGATAVYPVHAVSCVLAHYRQADTVIVAPDKGATARVRTLLVRADWPARIVQGLKIRHPQTGELTGFEVEDASAVRSKTCVILDDICDGGGTFSGLARVLDEAGAVGIDLFVTHGIFSKGGTVPGIRTIFTTDSYQSIERMPVGPIVMHVDMDKAGIPPKERVGPCSVA